MTFQSINYLRAAVALMVVLHHLPVQLERLGYRGPWPELFTSRVDIFFVISGFLIWIGTAGRQQSPQDFLFRRIARIVPLYWLLTTFMLLVMLFAPVSVQSGRLDLGHVLASYAFLPAVHPAKGYIAPLLIPGWTLNYEMFFYVVFAACLGLPERRRAFALIAVLVTLVLSRFLTPDIGAIGRFYTSSILLEFGLGVVVGALVSGGQRLSMPTAATLIAAGLAGLVVGPQFDGVPRAVRFGLPAALLVAGLVFAERNRRLAPAGRAVSVLGQSTYALFLSHGPVLSAACQLWVRSGAHHLPGAIAIFALLAVTAAVAVGVLLNRFVEAPINAYLRRKRAEAPDRPRLPAAA